MDTFGGVPSALRSLRMARCWLPTTAPNPFGGLATPDNNLLSGGNHRISFHLTKRRTRATGSFFPPENSLQREVQLLNLPSDGRLDRDAFRQILISGLEH